MPTVPMHHERAVHGCVSEALPHASRVTASSHVKGLAAGVRLSNEPSDDFTDFADCGSGTSAAQILIRPFSCWPPRSSAGGTLNGIVRDTYSRAATHAFRVGGQWGLLLPLPSGERFGLETKAPEGAFV